VNRWRVCVGSSYIGYYDSFEEACLVRDAEAIRQGGEFPVLNQDILNG
jgi:hypothetical protein